MKYKIVIFLLLIITNVTLTSQSGINISNDNTARLAQNLKVFDGKLFFTATKFSQSAGLSFHLYYIENENLPVEITSSTSLEQPSEFTILNNRMVFSAGSQANRKIFYINTGSTNLNVLTGIYGNEPNNFISNANFIFFQSNNGIYKWDHSNNNVTLLTNQFGFKYNAFLEDVVRKNLSIYDNNLYFYNSSNVYWVNINGGNLSSILPTTLNSTILNYENNSILFNDKLLIAFNSNSTSPNKIAIINAANGSIITIINAINAQYFVTYNNLVFFTTGSSSLDLTLSYIDLNDIPSGVRNVGAVNSGSIGSNIFHFKDNKLYIYDKEILINGTLISLSQSVPCYKRFDVNSNVILFNQKILTLDLIDFNFQLYDCSNQTQITCFESQDGQIAELTIYNGKVYMTCLATLYENKIFRYPEDPSGGLCNQNNDFSISGITYQDSNSNGIKENNEPAIPGVTVLFANGSGSISDIDGNYSLANQPTGNYNIKAIAPLGYSATLPINGETTISLPYNGASINFGFKKDCPHPDYIALRDLYISTNGPQWTNTLAGDLQWLVDCDPCGLIDGTPWKGIECNNMGRVDVINLNNNNLEGSLPPSIGQLSELEWFNVNRNKLSGNLPPEICNLNRMLHFVISNNMFSGNFPGCLANLPSLVRIVANYNKFTGTLPILGGTTQPDLINLHFDNNMFNGSIPSNYGNLPNLNYLAVANNDLSGCYPQVLSTFCSDPDFTSNTNALISDGNSFNASWSQFCATGAGSCTVSTADQDLLNITVYPNPVSNKLFINIVGINSSFDFKVYDNIGRQHELKSLDLQNGINSLDVSLLPPGIYFLSIGTNELQKFTKFIKIN